MRIVHFSDWHGNWRQLPKADLYICTGDMLDNYPEIHEDDIPTKVRVDWSAFATIKRKIVPEVEVKNQTIWLEQEEPLRRWLPEETKDSPVVLVRGNHCFVDYGKYFGGEYFEISEDAARVFEFKGLRIGGVRGIPYIAGEWSDEIHYWDMHNRITQLPQDLDVLVTHTPPHGILDKYFGGFDGIGCKAVRAYINQQMYSDGRLKLHLFGHSHREGGQIEEHGNIKFVNAAKTHMVIDL